MSDTRLNAQESLQPQVPAEEKPQEIQTEDKSSSSLYSCLVYCEQGVPLLEKQNHLKRLQNLRKELNHIKETEWMYDPVE